MKSLWYQMEDGLKEGHKEEQRGLMVGEQKARQPVGNPLKQP